MTQPCFSPQRILCRIASLGFLIVAACAGAPVQEPTAPVTNSASAEVPAAYNDPTGASVPADSAPASGGANVRVAQVGETGTHVSLAPDHPQRYTVVPGDTLWDISAMFLRDPWYWPEIWNVNPQIANPHLIYPGDVIVLSWVDGQPQLHLERDGTVVSSAFPVPDGYDKLSPRAREEALARAINTIPYDAIAPFLSRPTVLTRQQLKVAPYILSIREGHLVGGEGFYAYVRGGDLPRNAVFNVYHVGGPYRNPDTGNIIGYGARPVGQGRIIREGDPATLELTETKLEVLAGDRLVPVSAAIPPLHFFPRPPSSAIDGRIIDVVDGVSRIGQYQIVVLDRGSEDGLEVGNVLEIYQIGEIVRDRFKRAAFGQKVQLPEERAGILMVFRTLDELSYGLIMSATTAIRVLDIVRSP